MLDLRKTEDIYPAIKELIEELRKAKCNTLASILHHRMFKVTWTSSSELFEELVKVLDDLESPEVSMLPGPIISQIRSILKVLRKSL